MNFEVCERERVKREETGEGGHMAYAYGAKHILSLLH